MEQEDLEEFEEAKLLLRTIPDKWYDLGIELKIDEKKLQSVKEQYDDPEECLSQMLALWFEFSEEYVTVRDLAGPLRAINEDKLAHKGKYEATPTCFGSTDLYGTTKI